MVNYLGIKLGVGTRVKFNAVTLFVRKRHTNENTYLVMNNIELHANACMFRPPVEILQSLFLCYTS